MIAKAILFFLIISTVLSLPFPSVEPFFNSKSFKIPNENYPKLIKSITNGSQYFDNKFSYAYYFDDGKIASESVNMNKEISVKFGIEYKFFGTGYFRFVYKHQFYTLQYSLNDEKLEGTLISYFSDGTEGIEKFKELNYTVNKVKPYNEDLTEIGIQHLRSNSDYIIRFYFPESGNHPQFRCNFEANTYPQYHFMCTGDHDNGVPRENDLIKLVNECHENGDYSFNYQFGETELIESGNKNMDSINATGVLKIPDKNGQLVAHYRIETPNVFIKYSYPFNNDTVVDYYYPQEYEPDQPHSYSGLEFERTFEKLDGECVVKIIQKFSFLGPNGSGEEHVTYFHEFNLFGDNSTYQISGVAPTFACLQSCVGK